MSCCLVVDRAEVLGLKGGLIAVSCFFLPKELIL